VTSTQYINFHIGRLSDGIVRQQ